MACWFGGRGRVQEACLFFWGKKEFSAAIGAYGKCFTLGRVGVVDLLGSEWAGQMTQYSQVGLYMVLCSYGL